MCVCMQAKMSTDLQLLCDVGEEFDALSGESGTELEDRTWTNIKSTDESNNP